MKPPQPKLPQKKSCQTKAQQQSQQQQQQAHSQNQLLRDLASGCNLEALVLERFELPEQVAEFNKFEELSKLYEIEQPFVGRTQVELLFDVYDGRRLQQCLFGSLDDGGGCESEVDELTGSGRPHPLDQEVGVGSELDRDVRHSAAAAAAASSMGRGNSSSSDAAAAAAAAARRRSHFLSAHLRRELLRKGAGGEPKRGGLSWCRLLFARRRSGGKHTLPVSGRQRSACASPFKCCLRPSGTHQDLGLVSASTSCQTMAAARSADLKTGAGSGINGGGGGGGAFLSSLQAALAPNPEDELDESELKSEALRMVSGALVASSTGGRTLAELAQLSAPEPNLGPALAMESAQMESTGGSVSVCLLDTRRLAREPDWSQTAAAATGLVNGQRWARASAKLVQLRRKLRQSSASRLAGLGEGSQAREKSQPKLLKLKQEDKCKLLARQLDRVARKMSRKFWLELARDQLANETATSRERASAKCPARANNQNKWNAKADSEQLIELVKGSLNQLIDAQLLLRNKLTNAEQLNSSPIMNRVRSAEYENLLRNNFNLLKIWQNLEETSDGLACFVCEPIKASLADLFWFNRRRCDWAQAQAFELANLNSNTSGQSNGTASSQHPSLFVSPLICLDSSQVKRGLLQVS